MNGLVQKFLTTLAVCALFSSSGFLGAAYADAEPTQITVDSIERIVPSGSELVVGGTYLQGYHFRLKITLPVTERKVAFQLADWTGGVGSPAITGNTKFTISEHGFSNYTLASASLQDVENSYGVYLDANQMDANASLPGKQISIDVFYKIPVGSAGSYSTSYSIHTTTSHQFDLEAAKMLVNSKIQHEYTPGTWTSFILARTDALSLPEATDEEVVAKTEVLHSAIDILVSLVEEQALSDSKIDVNDAEESDYTEASWTTFITARTNALALPEDTHAEIVLKTTTLQNVFDALVTPLEEATAAVILAETTLKQKNVDTAQEMLDSFVVSEEIDALQDRLNVVQNIIFTLISADIVEEMENNGVAWWSPQGEPLLPYLPRGYSISVDSTSDEEQYDYDGNIYYVVGADDEDGVQSVNVVYTISYNALGKSHTMNPILIRFVPTMGGPG